MPRLFTSHPCPNILFSTVRRDVLDSSPASEPDLGKKLLQLWKAVYSMSANCHSAAAGPISALTWYLVLASTSRGLSEEEVGKP